MHCDGAPDHFLQGVGGAAEDALAVADHADGAAGVDHKDLRKVFFSSYSLKLLRQL